MIRWRFVITRLIVVAAVLMLLRWGLGPVANYLTVRGLQLATGAKVDIATTRVGLFPPRIYHADIRVADPRAGKQMEDIVRIGSLDLAIDGDALLHRRWIANEGRMTGLEIGADRSVSGHFEQQPEPIDDGSSSALTQLLAATGGQITGQLESVADDLETVRRSKEIRARWEAEYDQLAGRGKQLEGQIRQIRDRVKQVDLDNPLRDLPELERILADARSARSELVSVQRTLAALPERLQNDLSELDDAKRADIAKADRYIPGDLSNASGLGIDVMANAVRQQIRKVRDYVEGGRAIAEYTIVAPDSERFRGVDYDLRRVHRPILIVRRCEVGGTLRAEGDQYALTGIVYNMTPTPELLTEPTRTRLTLEGPQTVRVEYVRDRRDGAHSDVLTVHWPNIEADAIRIGNATDAGLVIEGGQRELWVQVNAAEERIDGRIVSKQTGVRMGLNVNPDYADSAAANSLRDSLAAVDRIELDATFGGTWDDLDLNLNSNLGQILHRASRDAIQSQLQHSRDQIAATINQAHADQTNHLRSWLASQQNDALSIIASADQSIEELTSKVLPNVGTADAYLGRLRNVIQGKLR